MWKAEPAPAREVGAEKTSRDAAGGSAGGRNRPGRRPSQVKHLFPNFVFVSRPFPPSHLSTVHSVSPPLRELPARHRPPPHFFALHPPLNARRAPPATASSKSVLWPAAHLASQSSLQSLHSTSTPAAPRLGRLVTTAPLGSTTTLPPPTIQPATPLSAQQHARKADLQPCR